LRSWLPPLDFGPPRRCGKSFSGQQGPSSEEIKKKKGTLVDAFLAIESK
jgi:hypothetical protein